MGFINKLGNFVEDAASFAVPAGLFALGTFAGGGNPLAGKALMGAGAAGLGGFSRNEEEERMRKAQEEARRSAAVANLMNAISPGTGARGAAGSGRASQTLALPHGRSEFRCRLLPDSSGKSRTIDRE